MLFLYNIGIRLYFAVIYFASLFNKKARLWIRGRKNKNFEQFSGSIWFHFASLGEFEQGRPVLEKLKEIYPTDKIVITFFSPSGYEIRKNTPLADAVYYLPLDTARNAKRFLDAIQPKMAVFTKYEYWYHFFDEAHRRGIPLYVISAIFRAGQPFFKWYGGLPREMLGFVSRVFVQDDRSRDLLHQIGLDKVTVSGDTRFDRVWANAQQVKPIAAVNGFRNGHRVFIAGSTWPPDEKLVTTLASAYPDWKFIIAPHEITGEKIKQLMELLPKGSATTLSQYSAANPHLQTLIIDNIGMLSSLYQYADIAYIGGGFGAGIHNTLEAAAFGVPVIFGPNYAKFKEAHDLIGLQAGFSVNNADELKSEVARLINDETFYHTAREKIGAYVKAHTGATHTISTYIHNDLKK